jgi:hypothetical protein
VIFAQKGWCRSRPKMARSCGIPYRLPTVAAGGLRRHGVLLGAYGVGGGCRILKPQMAMATELTKSRKTSKSPTTEHNRLKDGYLRHFQPQNMARPAEVRGAGHRRSRRSQNDFLAMSSDRQCWPDRRRPAVGEGVSERLRENGSCQVLTGKLTTPARAMAGSTRSTKEAVRLTCPVTDRTQRKRF